jgi:hypothetical protein
MSVDRDERQRILDSYDPTGHKVFSVRPDLVLNYYENNVRYTRIMEAMLFEVIDIERGRG